MQTIPDPTTNHGESVTVRGYFGSKAGAGVWQTILNQMPPHDLFIEAFAGSAAISKRKRPSRSTILIDKDAAAAQACTAAFSDRAVTVVCGDAISWLDRNLEHFNERTLIYCDPPYLFDVRGSPKPRYNRELGDRWLHVSLLELLDAVSSQGANVMISGYRSDLYDQIGWRRVDYTAQTHGGPRIESLWCNFPEPAQLHDYSVAGRDFRQRERLKKKKARWIAKLAAMPTLDRAAVLAAIDEWRNEPPF
jgi:site-specific DNA-adenine methylase